jgi:spore germination protein GerM
MALLAGALAALVAGCGVDPQAAPDDLDVPSIPAATSAPASRTSGPEVELWFLRDDRLTPVTRPADAADPATALELLAEGPSAEEAADGLTTAIGPPPLDVVANEGSDADDVLTVGVNPAFTAVAGEDQLREVAQVVWTVTGFAGVDAVRFTSDEGPLEVPTDAGLSDDPVDRDDFASLAPDGDVAID